MSEFESLRNANLARDREWDPDGLIGISFRGNELAGEVGEACNLIKKLDREKLGLRGSRTTPQVLATELADVIICVDLIAMEFGIDLWPAVRKKFNLTSRERGLEVLIP